ncbi:MAG: efflux RND transporter periplasmic adaptor subunit [Candidatus Aminicenantes bacterium]|nr:efflux RND transporter periplasmic adaptor subunit [Candidatus Aminicenantes bacterium]
MKKRTTWIIAFILVLAGLAVAAFVLLPGRGGKEEQGPKTARVVRRDIGSTVISTGIIKPMVGAEVKVGSRVSGVVRKLRAQIGDRVAAGQVIAELDDAELRAKAGQAAAALAKAEADLDLTRLNAGRLGSLFEKELISVQEWDQAQSAVKVAEAQREQALANVESAKVQLEYARIYAPVGGVIASISTQEGETVAASFAAPTFVNIIDLERLEVQAFVDETDIGRIREGLEAVFTVDTYPDAEFRGRVQAIYPKAVIQDNVVNYIVTVEITDNQGRILRPEMTANVTFFLEVRPNALAVPAAAIVRSGGERFVTVLIDGRTERRTVKTGWRDGGYMEILEGLAEGETVVIVE